MLCGRLYQVIFIRKPYGLVFLDLSKDILYLYRESVEREMDMGREQRSLFGHETHLVAHMGEISLAGLYLIDDLESVGETEMGEMLLFAEGVDNKDFYALELRYLLGRDEAGVGNIGQLADTVS